MKERAAELKAGKGGKKKADELQSLLDKIAEMAEDRVSPSGYALMSKIATSRRRPGTACRPTPDGKPLVFLQNAASSGRYCTLGSGQRGSR